MNRTRYTPTAFELELLAQYRALANGDGTQIAELAGMGNSIQLWVDPSENTVHAFGFAAWGPAGIGRTPYVAASFGNPWAWAEHPEAQAQALAWAAGQTFADVAVETGRTRAEATRELAQAFIGAEWPAMLPFAD